MPRGSLDILFCGEDKNPFSSLLATDHKSSQSYFLNVGKKKIRLDEDNHVKAQKLDQAYELIEKDQVTFLLKSFKIKEINLFLKARLRFGKTKNQRAFSVPNARGIKFSFDCFVSECTDGFVIYFDKRYTSKKPFGERSQIVLAHIKKIRKKFFDLINAE